MKFYNVPGVGKLTPGTQFTLDEITYPSNWLELATSAELAARGITTEESEPSLEHIRETRLEAVWTECNFRLEQATVSVDLGGQSFTFGLDRETRENIGGIVNAINAERSGLLPAGTVPNPRPFAPKGSPLLGFSHEALATVGAAVLSGKDAYMAAYFAHKAAINAATAEQLVAYDVLDGWPDG